MVKINLDLTKSAIKIKFNPVSNFNPCIFDKI